MVEAICLVYNYRLGPYSLPSAWLDQASLNRSNLLSHWSFTHLLGWSRLIRKVTKVKVKEVVTDRIAPEAKMIVYSLWNGEPPAEHGGPGRIRTGGLRRAFNFPSLGFPFETWCQRQDFNHRSLSLGSFHPYTIRRS